MKLHASVVEKLIYIFQNYGGHKDEKKLKKLIENLDLTPYERKTGVQNIILVLTEDYIKQLSGGEKK